MPERGHEAEAGVAIVVRSINGHTAQTRSIRTQSAIQTLLENRRTTGWRRSAKTTHVNRDTDLTSDDWRHNVQNSAAPIVRFGRQLIASPWALFPNRTWGLIAICAIAAELTLQLAATFHLRIAGAAPLSIAALATIVILEASLWIMATWLFTFVTSGLGRSIVASQVGRSLRYVVAAAAVLALATYVVCWTYFWRMGEFPDIEAFKFALINFEMISHYFWQAERRTLFIAVVIAVISLPTAMALVITFLPRLEKSVRAHGDRLHGRSLYVCVTGLLLLASLLFVSSQPTYAANQRGNWKYAARYRANPVATLAADALGQWLHDDQTEDIPLSALVPLNDSSGEKLLEGGTASSLPRSVIIVAIESLRSDVIGRIHQGRPVMPNLDRLAKSGSFFPNCYAQSTMSDYSDPCILSSLYPLRSVKRHYYSRNDPWPRTCLYDPLKKAGFSTAIFSSQNESWSHMDQFYESPALDVLFDSRTAKEHSYVERGGFTAWVKKQESIAGKLPDAFTLDNATTWIKGLEGKPFFLSLNFQTSHFPYQSPTGHVGPFTPANFEYPAPFLVYDAARAETALNAYLNALNYIDIQLGRLVQHLEDAGLRERTILIVTGDHGEAFGENGLTGHGLTPYEPVCRVGLVINGPGVPVTEDRYLTQAIDIAPTALGLAGVAAPKTFQGIDLLSEARPDSLSRVVYIHCVSAATDSDAIVTGVGWKLIHDHRRQEAELYHLPTDPGEQSNLAVDEIRIAESLDGLLMRWRGYQLSYYSNPAYYRCFCPPRSPSLSPATLKLITDKSSAKASEVVSH